MRQQLSHKTTEFKERKFPIVLILDGISGPANIGSLFRLADAFNIEKIVLSGPKANMESPRLRKTARTTIDRVKFEQREEAAEVCSELSKEGFQIFALEITSNSLPIDSYPFESCEKLALILGNENTGVSEELLENTYKNLYINMFGHNSSMNVAQAAGIALYEITKSLPAI